MKNCEGCKNAVCLNKKYYPELAEKYWHCRAKSALVKKTKDRTNCQQAETQTYSGGIIRNLLRRLKDAFLWLIRRGGDRYHSKNGLDLAAPKRRTS